MINPHVLPGNVGPFVVRRAVLTPRARRGTIVSFDAATWKASVQLDGALAALNIKVADFVNTASLIAGAQVAVVLFNDSNPDDGLVIGTYGNVGGKVFSDAEGDPADIGAAADGTSNYSTRRDHAHSQIGAIQFTVDGGGSPITTGQMGHVEAPYACTITRATLLADQSGSIVVDIWKDTYANFPPTVADTITASAKPTLASAQKSQDSTLTGWTTAIAAGDVLAFNVDSASTLTRVVLSLKVRRS